MTLSASDDPSGAWKRIPLPGNRFKWVEADTLRTSSWQQHAQQPPQPHQQLPQQQLLPQGRPGKEIQERGDAVSSPEGVSTSTLGESVVVGSPAIAESNHASTPPAQTSSLGVVGHGSSKSGSSTGMGGGTQAKGGVGGDGGSGGEGVALQPALPMPPAGTTQSGGSGGWKVGRIDSQVGTHELPVSQLPPTSSAPPPPTPPTLATPPPIHPTLLRPNEQLPLSGLPAQLGHIGGPQDLYALPDFRHMRNEAKVRWQWHACMCVCICVCARVCMCTSVY